MSRDKTKRQSLKKTLFTIPWTHGETTTTGVRLSGDDEVDVSLLGQRSELLKDNMGPIGIEVTTEGSIDVSFCLNDFSSKLIS